MSQLTVSTASGAIGIDLGDRSSRACVLDAQANVESESSFPTTEEGFRKQFAKLAPTRVAIEVGTHSPWVSRLLKELGHEVIVANARKLRLIYENDRKDDRVDAMYLARLARLDPNLLSPVTHVGAESQADRAMLHARDALVRARAALVNQVRGLVKAMGSRLPASSTDAFAAKVRDEVPEVLRPALEPIIDAIDGLSKSIRVYDRRIDEVVAKRYPLAEHVTSVPGVGNLTALAYMLVIEDPKRFRRSRDVAAYLGLTPRRDQSGGSDPELRITKAGNGFVRRLLVQSAHYILGPFAGESDLRDWGLKLAARGKKTAKKRAVVAVARKLAVLLHHLWATRSTYEPQRNAG